MVENKRFQIEDYEPEADFEPIFPDENATELTLDQYQALFGHEFDVKKFVGDEVDFSRIEVRYTGNIPIVNAQKVYRVRRVGYSSAFDLDLEVYTQDHRNIIIESVGRGVIFPVVKNPETGIFYASVVWTGEADVIRWSMENVIDAQQHIDVYFP